MDRDRDRQRISLLGLVRDDIRLDEVFEEPLLHLPPRFPAGLTGSLWKKSILGPSFKGCQDRARKLDWSPIATEKTPRSVRHRPPPAGSGDAGHPYTPSFWTRTHAMNAGS